MIGRMNHEIHYASTRLSPVDCPWLHRSIPEFLFYAVAKGSNPFPLIHAF
jgi:hypothetical protein